MVCGCARLGDLGPGVRGTLALDATTVPADDLAAPGPHAVVAQGLEMDGIQVALYRPADVTLPGPALVFLPGLMASEDQYESYGRALASHGFVVLVRGWYGPFKTDRELAQDAIVLGNALVEQSLADPLRMAVGGHSMGGKDAILAAVQEPVFRAVLAFDPDDSGEPSVVDGYMDRLTIPLLLVGAEEGWRGWWLCAPLDHNYQRFFEHAPAGTIEVTLRGADHVQFLDDPDRFGQGICRVGTADSQLVRNLVRRVTSIFLLEKLQGTATSFFTPAFGEGAWMRVKQEPQEQNEIVELQK